MRGLVYSSVCDGLLAQIHANIPYRLKRRTAVNRWSLKIHKKLRYPTFITIFNSLYLKIVGDIIVK